MIQARMRLKAGRIQRQMQMPVLAHKPWWITLTTLKANGIKWVLREPPMSMTYRMVSLFVYSFMSFHRLNMPSGEIAPQIMNTKPTLADGSQAGLTQM